MANNDENEKFSIGYTAGVFDLFHIGHYNFLKHCKEQCEQLIVGVCDDEYVRNVKNVEPVESENERNKNVGSIGFADSTFLTSSDEVEDKMIIWNRIHFDVLFTGEDWKGTELYLHAEEAFSKIGVRIIYIPYTMGISTTKLKSMMNR